jgi:uncharacterized membrane protein
MFRLANYGLLSLNLKNAGLIDCKPIALGGFVAKKRGCRLQLRYLGLAVVFLWFFVGGIAHFTNASMFVRIVPPYVPFATAVVYVSGVLELLGAIGILLPTWRQWAGNGLLLLTVCVTPANVYMWLNAHLFPEISPQLLFWRLPLQVLLLFCVAWSTRTGRLKYA